MARKQADHYSELLMADVMRNGNLGRSTYKHKSGTMKQKETIYRFFFHCLRYYHIASKDIR